MVWLAKSWFALAVVVLAIFPWFPRAYAGNTTCASSQLDWYTNYVGESPCDTYQRLRRICNPDYEVQNLRPDAPGDQCDDQVSGCCCNTIAFQLSMLCMNCQYDSAAVQNKNAVLLFSSRLRYECPVAAAVGTYTIYRGSCGAGINYSLSADLQSAVCNENIRLDNFLYGGWDTGDCIWTRDNATRDHAASNNNTFTHCPNQEASSSIDVATTLSTGATTTSFRIITTMFFTASVCGHSLFVAVTNSDPQCIQDTPSPTAEKDNSGGVAGGNHVGAIVGGCLGAVAGILLLGGLFMFWRTRRNQSRVHLVQSYHRSEPSQMMMVLPSSSIGACEYFYIGVVSIDLARYSL
ncbi:hypothetical protein K466DRAFT_496071 [Polyporus arcularius HHB13444]|uniref:Uncharacterized protein n=1 Tax=Polyporus arcularius HHB13444 TaxID=1314778 RepID=A0A5C3P656_9APHY|nr:hypothetical protein K466DRAFT_496071 [Polyporus arcularius HHB13444]